MKLIQNIQSKAANNIKNIVLPEGYDERTIQAARILKDRKLVEPVVLGTPSELEVSQKKAGTTLEGIQTIDPTKDERLPEFTNTYYELRKHKGMTLAKAEEMVKNHLYFGALLLRSGVVHGAVAGAANTTGDVMRAAIQVVGLEPGIQVVSSSFLMVMPDEQVLTFGDCAVIPDPTAEQLASIAVSSANTHQLLYGEDPKVAMLSFSTKGSAEHPLVDKVIEATHIVQSTNPQLSIDGELQFDAAYLEKVGAKKAPGSSVAGKANVFIFPDLNAGNIGYKMVQRLAGAEAVGPVIQGLAKPYNDLSRGCSVDDIVNVACICSLLAK